MVIRLLVAVIALLFIVYVLLREKTHDKQLCIISYWYVALLFSLYPLVFSPIQGYYAMGIFKFRIWAAMTACLILYSLFIFISDKRTFSISSKLDIAMIVFASLVTISFLLSGNKLSSLTGFSGWYTGLLFLYGLVLVYFIISRNDTIDNRFIWIIEISAIIIFAIGTLHRFYIDPIGIMKTLSPNECIRFLSTIGQATWYSSYLCLVFPIGLYAFISFDDKRNMIVSTIFLITSACTLVTQNSDSAYISMFVIIVSFLVYAMYKSGKCLMRLGISFMIMSCSIILIGLIERFGLIPIVSLDVLSINLATGIIPVIGVVTGLILVFLNVDPKIYEKLHSKLPIICTTTLIIFIAIAIIVGIKLISISANDVYFETSKDWGNGRGLIWLRTLQMYKDLPLVNKLLGVGPGCFNDHISNYTELILANAHSEWLTAIIEYGIIGGFSYLAIFIIALIEGIKMIKKEAHADFSINMGIIVFACTLGYIVHNAFNYQQCISTPMIITLIGIAHQSFLNMHPS
ncbi:O-antigen ligase family protein [Butyrivibrio hungatei]|uniref:Polysaccharide biosynthesis protein n=1 Tax=Butyrivibrio hungatei TaxID=185008 RepID=A0A1D9NZZ9_9FIRM|nr:O-antigen ligase family protein [Butyrivibrio hungatei]AOZ95525.1 polysaccharide biosynthesis protein [Butyrivibrio hungatei]